MKKTIALLVTLMIVLLPLSVVVASTSELTWGMSKQEVINSLGEPEETNTLNDAITSDAETIIYTNQKISKYEDAALILFFEVMDCTVKIMPYMMITPIKALTYVTHLHKNMAIPAKRSYSSRLTLKVY